MAPSFCLLCSLEQGTLALPPELGRGETVRIILVPQLQNHLKPATFNVALIPIHRFRREDGLHPLIQQEVVL